MCHMSMIPPIAAAPALPEPVAAYVGKQDAPLRDVAAALCALVTAELPDAEGVVWHGHPVWRLGGEPAVLVKAYPRHVTLGFWRGQEILEPTGRLVPGARGMAAIRLHGLGEIDRAAFADWLRQARELEAVAAT